MDPMLDMPANTAERIWQKMNEPKHLLDFDDPEVCLCIIQHRKWKNGHLIQLVDYFRKYQKINWNYTDFESSLDYLKWLTKKENKK